jgi:hypothetical protein
MDRPLIAEGGRSGDLTPRDNLEGTTGQMAHYAAYTTTIMGAHSVPRWYEAHWSQDWTWRALAGRRGFSLKRKAPGAVGTGATKHAASDIFNPGFHIDTLNGKKASRTRGSVVAFGSTSPSTPPSGTSLAVGLGQGGHEIGADRLAV